MNNVPIVKDICFVGGGHSHALVLRQWAMNPLPGVRLTLVSSTVQTPYSGMLPGLIAGHYSYDDVHIDLSRLCSWAGVRFIEDTVTGIDLAARQVQFSERPALSFDVLSLDTGSTPDLSITGSAQYTTPVKPVSDFYTRWQKLQDRLQASQQQKVAIGVVGSGAGGFELITAMRHRLKQTNAHCCWFLRGNSSISGRPARVGELAEQAAMDAGIEIIRNFDVSRVESGKLIAADKREFLLDEIIWCTAATGPEWPAAAALDVDSRGFVATNAYLQSTSHPFVFATGDIGTQVDTPSNKAGVFAVRQAPVLFENLRRLLLKQKLKTYVPQSDFLSLMATGPQHGIANRGPLVVQGDWVWRWKNHIDQTFMDQFKYLPKRHMNGSLNKLHNSLIEPRLKTASVISLTQQCRGCGAKVGEQVLQRVLDELLPIATSEAPSALSPAADVAVVDLPSKRLVQSIDQINTIVDDPYVLGRIAALHAISDVVTLDATLHSAQVMLSVPQAVEEIVERDLRLLMQGILSVLNSESCAVIGGHTTQGPDMSAGLCINAVASASTDISASMTSHSFSSGDALILTKPIGVGVLFAAQMQTQARGVDIIEALASMQQNNRPAADIIRQHQCVAMTDVTGFGLIGHLRRLLSRCEHEAVLDLSQVPLLGGALELSHRGINSSLWQQNSRAFSDVLIDDDCDDALLQLLADPQTSGGLLAVVPGDKLRSCLDALHTEGYTQAACVGNIQSLQQVEQKDEQRTGASVRISCSQL